MTSSCTKHDCNRDQSKYNTDSLRNTALHAQVPCMIDLAGGALASVNNNTTL